MTVPALDVRQIATHHSLHRLNNWLQTLAQEADELAEQGDKRALAYGLNELREFRRHVADLERHIENHVADLMRTDIENLDDDELVLERRRGTARKQWQSEELLRHLVGDQIVDVRTGENVYDLLVSVLPLTASLSWRAGALRGRGVSPDDWCEASPGRVSVKVSVKEQQ